VPVGEPNSPFSDEASQLPPPEWEKESSPVLRRIVGVAACIAVAAAIIVIWRFDLFGSDEDATGDDRQNAVQDVVTSPSTPETAPGANLADVGDCVKVVKGGVDAELGVVECGSADARYTVALELEMPEKCPAGPYVEYSAVGLGGWSLCLELNANVGQCFKNDAVVGFTLTKCAAGEFKVVKVLAKTADRNACPPLPPDSLFNPEPLVYPTPPLTICLAGAKK